VDGRDGENALRCDGDYAEGSPWVPEIKAELVGRAYHGWGFHSRTLIALGAAAGTVLFVLPYAWINFFPWYLAGFLVSGLLFSAILPVDVELRSGGLSLHHFPESGMLFFMGYFMGAVGHIVPSILPELLFVLFFLLLVFFVLMLAVHWKRFPQPTRQTEREAITFWLVSTIGMFFGIIVH
jgi:hypothetical protein